MKLFQLGFLAFALGALLGCQTTTNSNTARTTGQPTLPNEQELIEMASSAYKAQRYREPLKIDILSVKQEQVYFTGKQWIVCFHSLESVTEQERDKNGKVIREYPGQRNSLWAMDLNHTSRDGWYVGILRFNGEPFGSKNVTELCEAKP